MLKLLIQITFLLAFSVAPAEVRLSLKNADQYSAETRSVVSAYFSEVKKALPPHIPFLRDLKIQVQFKKMNGTAKQMLRPTTSVEMGKVSLFSWENTIQLNQEILNLFNNKELSTASSYRHNHGRKLAIATLVHEIAHIIDLETSFSNEIKEDISKCKDQRRYPDYVSQYFKTCNEALTARGKISDHPDFNRQTRWDNLKASENHPGSPNLYEYENSNEYFAVNFEYFLLDPQFKCRRPATYQLYKTIFQWSPESSVVCNANHEVFYHNKAAKVNITPARVLKVSYLHAGTGTAAMSRWGHAMLHLSVCKTDLVNEQDTCERNKENVVIGFQAEVKGNYISSFQGLFGGYASKLFVLDFKKVIADYTKNEFRPVHRYDLNLTKKQQDQLVNRILENYWGYAGKYYFITNNCASEAFSLLKSVLPTKHGFNRKTVSTPIGILTSLKRTGLIADKETQSFNSYKNTLDLALTILDYKNRKVQTMSYAEYEVLTSENRFELFKGKTAAKEIAAFQILESFILTNKMTELDSKIFDLAIKRNELKSKSKNAKGFSFINKSSSYTYGIAQGEELSNLNDYQTVWTDLAADQQNTLGKFAGYFPELRHEIQKIQLHIKLSREAH